MEGSMRLGSIGAGHMGGAILQAVLDTGLFTPQRVHISSPVPSELEPYAKRGCRTNRDNVETARNADLILLAVRPHQIQDVLKEIAAETEWKCVLSIAAGVTVASIKESLPNSVAVLRAMPNLPLAYGSGATVMAIPGRDVPNRFFDMTVNMFKSAGKVVYLKEELINAATALGGSAVAYFFRMASVMAGWAEQNGIHPYEALQIINQSMAGASEMLTRSEKTPSELASGVAVPGGTTEAAFQAFDQAGFDEALIAGMNACRDRGIELVSSS
ncbi:MAG: pyrroline-5-carboxylate reductase [Oscillospiraceae bacterium]|nr:pyrroline-5-carboxylate reductase [Oscillospiraceae bacterium]